MQMNLFEQNAKRINDAEQLEADQEEQKQLDNYPVVDNFGIYGVKWRERGLGRFGFTCAGCGASTVNQDPLNHTNNCDSTSPYKETK
jgi:hypothetical protein